MKISINSNTLIQAVKFTLSASAKKDVRYYLNTVLIEIKDNTMWIVGTDGHRMAYCELLTDDPIDLPDYQILLKRSCAEQISKVKLRNDNDVAVLDHTSLSVDGMTITLDIEDGKFPDWRRVAYMQPEDGIVDYVYHMNLTYQADACKACKVLAPRYDVGKMTVEPSPYAARLIVEPLEIKTELSIKSAKVLIMGVKK